jgi:hypothetical protein
MPDLGSAFTRATAYTHAPWWRRLLYKPAATLLYATLLRRPRCVPLALQVPAHTFFEEEMRVVLPEGSACRIFCHGAIEEDVTAFLLTHVTEGMTFIFEDHWDKFRDWDSPFDLVPDIEAVAAREAPEAGAAADADRFQEHLPWDVIRATAMALRGTAVEHKADAFEAVPDGWLVLERDDEDEGVRTPIAVYRHQRPCWDALVAHHRSLRGDALQGARVEDLYEEFFADCDVPVPSPHLVGRLVQHLARGGVAPEYYDLAGRRACDPHEIARRIKHDDLGYGEMSQPIERAYTGLACAIYPSLREYRVAVEDALYELDHPDDTTRPVCAIPVFEPRADEQLTSGPAHDLEALMREVLASGADLLGLPALEFPGTLAWSRRLLKGWYGMAYTHENPLRIRINRLLDSPDISVATMRFLIWHEFLHVHLAAGHTKTFREYERRWPGCVAAERELDTPHERFGVHYW